MDDDTEREHEEREETQGEPADDEQGAALGTSGEDLDEEQAETGEGILDHPEHSDAPGPFGTG